MPQGIQPAAPMGKEREKMKKRIASHNET